MRLNSLSMKNFKKYRGAVRVEFQDGLTGIVGGNGSGKSSIVEAIAWALYGSRASTVRREFIKNSRAFEGEDLEVTLSLNSDGKEMTILRAMRGKNMTPEARLRIDGELVATGTREVDGRLEEILRISFADFMKTFYARQKDLDNLIRDRGSEKREYLLSLLGLDEVRDRAMEEIRSDLREAEGEIGRLEGALAEIGDVGEMIGLRGQEVARVREEVAIAMAREADLAVEVEKRRRTLEVESERRRTRDRLRVETDRLTRDLEERRRAILLDEKRLSQIEEGRWRLFELEPKLARLASVREELEEMAPKRARHQELMELRARAKAEMEGRSRNLKEAETRLQRLQEERRELESIRPREEEYRRIISDLEALEAKRDRYQSLSALTGEERGREEAARKNASRAREALLGLRAAEDRMEEIGPSVDRYRALEAEISRQKNERDKRRRLSEMEERSRAVSSRIDLLRAQVAALDGEIQDLGDLPGREADLQRRGEEIDRRLRSIDEEIADLNLRISVSGRELAQAAEERSRIEALGEESLCPTCERPLAGQRDLLLEKYETAASKATERISRLEEMRGEAIARREGAARSAEELRIDLSALAGLKARAAEILAEKRSHLSRISELLDEGDKMKAEMEALGPADFDPEIFDRMEEEAEALLDLVGEYAALAVRIEEIPKLRGELEEATRSLAASLEKLASLAEMMAELGYSEDERTRARERISFLRGDHQRFTALEHRTGEIPDLEEAVLSGKREVERLKKRYEEVEGEIELLGFSPATDRSLLEEAKDLQKAEAVASQIRLALAAEGEVRLHREEAEAAATRIAAEICKIEEKLSALGFSDGAYQEAEAALEGAGLRLEEARKMGSQLAIRLALAEGELERLKREASRKRELEEKAAGWRVRVQVLETTRGLANRFMDAILVRIRREIAENAGRILREVTGKYGRISIDDDFNILVEDEGEFYPISRFSGGEIDMIAVSVRVAISEYLMRFSQNGPGYSFLILDEVFGSQDVEHRESMINMLRSLDDRFPQIFAISHIGEVQGQFENSILVVEDEDGSSRIEVEMR
ncbi:MAG: Exonuclease SbcC [Methanothrix sp.]|jgi:exonuclease SbcC|nr:MAG: Exonuclease SbcC [Methanothrix sp.]